VAEGGASTEFWTCCSLSTSVAHVDGIVAGVTFSEVVLHVVVPVVLDVLVLVGVRRATNSSSASALSSSFRDDFVVVLGRSLVDTAESVAMVVGVVLVATRVDSGVDDVEDDHESHSNSREEEEEEEEGAIGVVGGADGDWRWRTLRVGVRAAAVVVLDVAASASWSAIFASTIGGAAAAAAVARPVEAGVTGTAAVNLREREAKGIGILGG